MTFTVRDLMMDVLPATFADADGLRLCEGNITMTPQPQPPPKPKPKPKPGRGYVAAGNGELVQGAEDGAAELAPLPVLRKELHQALHP
jgi:hypothetical protein